MNAILILVPLKMEWEILFHLLQPVWGRATIDTDHRGKTALFNRAAIYLSVGGAGAVSYATTAEIRLKKISQLTALLCVGSAGALTTTNLCGGNVVAGALAHASQPFNSPPLPADQSLLSAFTKIPAV